jgi:SNF2 family DNA or RNA helicase
VPHTLLLQVVSKLHNLLKPFMLRRLKADVEICLPRKQEVLLYAPMSEQQQTINSQLLEKTLGVRGPRLAMGLCWTFPRLLWQCTHALPARQLSSSCRQQAV